MRRRLQTPLIAVNVIAQGAVRQPRDSSILERILVPSQSPLLMETITVVSDSLLRRDLAMIIRTDKGMQLLQESSKWTNKNDLAH